MESGKDLAFLCSFFNSDYHLWVVSDLFGWWCLSSSSSQIGGGGGRAMGWFVVLGFGVRVRWFPNGFVPVSCIVVSLGFGFFMNKSVGVC